MRPNYARIQYVMHAPPGGPAYDECGNDLSKCAVYVEETRWPAYAELDVEFISAHMPIGYRDDLRITKVRGAMVCIGSVIRIEVNNGHAEYLIVDCASHAHSFYAQKLVSCWEPVPEPAALPQRDGDAKPCP